MFTTTIKFHDNSPNISDQNNSRLMDDLVNDLEEGLPYNPIRQLNKKKKKRKQLDALLKFRSSNRKALRSSEDELFLPDEKSTQIKHPSHYRHWCSYTRHILSFCLVCIFMIVCVGLGYANIELKNEVQNLSSRVTEIEKRFSNFEINRVISTIEQIKIRLNLIERWNVSYIYERLQKLQTPLNEMPMNDEDVDVSSKLDTIEQKSTHLSEVADELDKLSHDADNQAKEKIKPIDKDLIEHLLEEERRENARQDKNQLLKNILSLNESLYANTVKWKDELKSLRDDFQNLNQSLKIQELVQHFQELTNLVHNSSDKTSAIITALQSDLDKLRSQIEACKCTKEPIHLKPSIVDSDQLQQSIITKPNTATTSSPELSNKTDHNNTIEITQIVNKPSSVPH